MGAFHEGHLELMRVAKAECACVVTSLFVNPTQFGPSEDLARYPRNEERDAQMAAEVGVDILFCPTVEEMYPLGWASVHLENVTDNYEGAARPTHFDGVTTIVLKLFACVQPQLAVFGLKDLQQCAVVSAMVKDLLLPVELKFVEVVREPSGLAKSSRNVFLSESERENAAALFTTLSQIAKDARSGEAISHLKSKGTSILQDLGFDVDYLELINPSTMKPVSCLEDGARWMACARYGGVRLLDNIAG